MNSRWAIDVAGAHLGARPNGRQRPPGRVRKAMSSFLSCADDIGGGQVGGRAHGARSGSGPFATVNGRNNRVRTGSSTTPRMTMGLVERSQGHEALSRC
jgi:hypothetical protein